MIQLSLELSAAKIATIEASAKTLSQNIAQEGQVELVLRVLGATLPTIR